MLLQLCQLMFFLELGRELLILLNKFSRGSAVNIGFDSGIAVGDIILKIVCSIMVRLSIVRNTYI